jgi:hypothetical protein
MKAVCALMGFSLALAGCADMRGTVRVDTLRRKLFGPAAPNGPSPRVKGMAPPAGSWLKVGITADKPDTARDAQSFGRRD